MLYSTHSQNLKMGKDPRVTFGEPLKHVITLCGQILVCRTDDDSLPSPCVHSKRHRVYRHHAHMLKHLCAWCRYTRRRFERTHGDVFERTHGVFQRVNVHHTTHRSNTTTTPLGDRDRETEQEDRDRERREDGRGDTREKREDEREAKDMPAK